MKEVWNKTDGLGCGSQRATTEDRDYSLLGCFSSF